MTYNPFSVSSTLHRKEIILRPPTHEQLGEMTEHERENIAREAHVYLQELPEKKRKRRANSIIDQSKKGRGGTQIRLDRQRDFDWQGSLMDWTFTKDGMKLRAEGQDRPATQAEETQLTNENSNKLSLNIYDFGELPAYITEQIIEHVNDLHDVPEDESSDEDDEGTRSVKENPTSENSGLRPVSG